MFRPGTAERAKFVFGMPMKPCPKCGGYDIHFDTPIEMEAITPQDTAKQLLAKWGRAVKAGAKMRGPVCIMCHDCMHKGPSVDCTGRLREDVGRDVEVALSVKSLWNSQEPVSGSIRQ